MLNICDSRGAIWRLISRIICGSLLSKPLDLLDLMLRNGKTISSGLVGRQNTLLGFV